MTEIGMRVLDLMNAHPKGVEEMFAGIGFLIFFWLFTRN